MICPACGEKIGDDSRFCLACGYKIGNIEQESKAPEVAPTLAARPLTQRTNKIVIFSAIAVVALAIVGILWAVGGSKKNGDMEQQVTEGTAQNASGQKAVDQSSQPQEQMNQPVESGQLPADKSDQVRTPEPSLEKKPAPKPSNALEGRWEGTWRASFNDSGSCSVTVRHNSFRALCYDNQFSGRVIGDGRSNIRFEGGSSSWSCRLYRQAGKQVLKCSFSARGSGASGSQSGDLSLYRK
jgi:hypothetical protein